MKRRSYRLLFRFFSFLSDKTNGASLFVRYKLILGTLLVGLTVSSCGKEEDEDPPVSCYLTYNPENTQARTESKQNVDDTLSPFQEESFE